MTKVTTESLLKILKDQGRDVQIQEETGQIYEVLKINDRDFPLFTRVMEGATLIQLLAFFPTGIKTEAMPELARLLHLLNKELDIPGFGLDEQAGVAFYRCMIPTIEGEVPEKVLEGFINSVQIVCETFMPAVEAVAVGATSFEDLVKKAEEEKKKMQG